MRCALAFIHVLALVVGGGAFHCESYILRYRDLRDAFGSDCNAAANHFNVHGIKEGRDASKGNDYDCHSYLNRYTDLNNAFGNNCDAAWKHYLDHGEGEGRDPSYDTEVCYDPCVDIKHKILSKPSLRIEARIPRCLLQAKIDQGLREQGVDTEIC